APGEGVPEPATASRRVGERVSRPAHAGARRVRCDRVRVVRARASPPGDHAHRGRLSSGVGTVVTVAASAAGVHGDGACTHGTGAWDDEPMSKHERLTEPPTGPHAVEDLGKGYHRAWGTVAVLGISAGAVGAWAVVVLSPAL